MVGGTPLAVPGLRSQVLHASHALLALYVATSIDVLLARFWLPGAESGVYAVGALVSKVAFWLPSFVAVVTFPGWPTSGAGRRRSRRLRQSPGSAPSSCWGWHSCPTWCSACRRARL